MMQHQNNYNDGLSQALNLILSNPNQLDQMAPNQWQDLQMNVDEPNYALNSINLLSQYCWCEDLWQPAVQPLKAINPNIAKITNESTFDTMSTSSKAAKGRNGKKKALPQIDQKIKQVFLNLETGNISEFTASKKKVKGFFSNKSGRRSMYIGVSKNNYNWQVLINVGNKKKYIGTFPTQKEAAIAYDFYSVALHSEKAKTNFNYSGSLMKEMIQSYLNSASADSLSRSFTPSQFAERV